MRNSSLISALALKINRAKRFAEAVGYKNASVGEHSTLEGSTALAVMDEAEARTSTGVMQAIIVKFVCK